MKNILLENFDTPYSTAPFDRIQNEFFTPAIHSEIGKLKEEIDRISENPEAPDFSNTIEAMEFAGLHLDRLTSILFNLNSAETNEEIQKIAREISPELSALQNDIIQNEDLFHRIRQVYQKRHDAGLDPEQRRVLELTYRKFVRNGAMLAEDAKKELKEIDRRLADLKLKFGEHVLNDTHSHFVHFETEEQVGGIPETALNKAREKAVEQDKEGWVFGLDYPSYHAVMTYAKHRESRKEMYLEYGRRGYRDNDNNNASTVLEIVELRKRRARLLGYKTHADFVLEERMAKTPERVMEFLEDLYGKVHSAAHRDLQKLSETAAREGIHDLRAWDVAYYMEKLKKRELDFDDEELKPYFPLDNVLQGVFDTAGKLYGLRFEPNSEISVYHPDVQAFTVFDEKGEYLSVLYVDLFPRSGKRSGAWMTSYKTQWKRNGQDSRPHISVVCNFTPPQGDKPSLLTFREVTTLFHEFGHALHGMLSRVHYPSVSGTSVLWDFVELPSQIMENWAYEKPVLEKIARHYLTGETLPAVLMEKIGESRRFMEGWMSMRQLGFGFLDMAWHYGLQDLPEDVKVFERQAFEKTRLLPDCEKVCMSVSFGHLFAGGYSAGYYSYKWAEVLAADAFELFSEKGVFNRETALSFRKNILEKGGSEDPDRLYKAFRKRPPSVDALLRQGGLL